MIKIHEIKTIIHITLPLTAAFLAQKGMGLIDAIMMGWIGPEALAAGILGTGCFFTAIIFCMGTLSAVGVFISRARGANDPLGVKVSMQHGICLTLFLSVLSLLIVWFLPSFLLMIGEEPNVIVNVRLFLNALILGLPGFLFFYTFREFVSAFGYTRVVMIVALISLPLTFAANYVLIYGYYGFPKLGIAGIGYAGAIIMWFMALCLFLYSKFNPVLREFIVFKDFKFDLSKITDMLHIGLPSGLWLLFESTMFFAATIIIGYFGVDALAAHQIAMQCAMIAYSIPFSLSMASALQVSHALGAKNYFQMKRVIIISYIAGLIFAIIMAMIFVFAPDQLVHIFLKGDEINFNQIKQLTISLLFLAAMFQCFDTIQAVASGSLRGLHDTFIPMIICVVCYSFIGIGSAYLLAFHTSIGAVSVWYGLTFGLCGAGIILTVRLVSKLLKTREILR